VVLVGRQLLEIHLVVAVAVIRQENKFLLLSGRSNEKRYRESNSPDSFNCYLPQLVWEESF
jgi:hypothetical protein